VTTLTNSKSYNGISIATKMMTLSDLESQFTAVMSDLCVL